MPTEIGYSPIADVALGPQGVTKGISPNKMQQPENQKPTPNASHVNGVTADQLTEKLMKMVSKMSEAEKAEFRQEIIKQTGLTHLGRKT